MLTEYFFKNQSLVQGMTLKLHLLLQKYYILCAFDLFNEIGNDLSNAQNVDIQIQCKTQKSMILMLNEQF